MSVQSATDQPNTIVPSTTNIIINKTRSLIVTAYIINGIISHFLNTSFGTICTWTISTVVIEEHLLLNSLCYLLKWRHQNDSQWKLTENEKIIATMVLGVFNMLLLYNTLNVFSSVLVYRIMPLSPTIGLSLACINIFFDIYLLYPTDES